MSSVETEEEEEEEVCPTQSHTKEISAFMYKVWSVTFMCT